MAADGNNTAINTQASALDQQAEWTVYDLRKNASAWSLAGDAALLQLLKAMSAKMISRTHELNKSVDQLSANIKTCAVTARNTFNEFITLADSQFVENRVYDEEVTTQADTSVTNQADEHKEKSREEVEAQLIPKITQSVQLGLNVLETAYQKLDVNIEHDDDDDDDDEPGSSEPILEIKDPYVLRPLPYLIASADFKESDTVGLKDAVDDDSSQLDAGSISSDSDGEITVSRRGTTTEPAAAANVAGVPRKPLESDDDEEEYSYSESEDEEKNAVTAGSDEEEDDDDRDMFAPAVSLAKQLEQQLGRQPKERSATKDSEASSTHEHKPSISSARKSSMKKKTAVMSDDLFGPASDDDDDGDGDLFGSGAGLFRNTRAAGLFDSSPPEDGNLFDDVEDADVDSFVSSKQKTAAPVDKEASQPKPNSAGDKPQTGLFGSPTSNDSDDLFGGSAVGPSAAVTTEVSRSRTRTDSGRKLPPGAVPMFGGGGLAAALSKRRGPATEESDEESDGNSEDKRPVSAAAEPSKKAGKAAAAAAGLFGDDDEDGEDGDDLFRVTTSKKLEQPKTQQQRQQSAQSRSAASSSLFDNSDDGADDLFSKRPERKQPTVGPAGPHTKTSKVSLFGDSDEEDSDEGVMAEPSKPANKSSTMRPTPGATTGGGLFSDSDDNDTFISKPAPATSKSVQPNKTSTGLFSDSDDDDMFSSKPKSTASVVKPSAVATGGKARSASAAGLFSDSDDDMFSSAKPSAQTVTSQTPAVTSQTPAPPLIDDGDEESSAPVKSKAVGPKKPAGAVSMFGGMDPTALRGKLASRRHQSDDEEQEEEGQKEDSEGPAEAPSIPQRPAVVPPPQKSSAAAGGGLFGSDSDDDDMFSSKQKSTALAVKPASAAGGKVSSASAAGLFSDSDDDMFSSAKPSAQTVTSQTPAVMSQTPAVTSQTPAPPLVDDEDEESSAPVKPKAVGPKKPAGAVSMFGGMDPTALRGKLASRRHQSDDEEQENEGQKEDSEEPVKAPSEPQHPAVVPPPQKSSAAAGGGLFGSDSDDDDMFSSEPKSRAPAVKPASTAGGKVSSASAAGLFSDSDDDMFSSSRASALTSQTPAVTSQTPAVTSQTPAVTLATEDDSSSVHSDPLSSGLVTSAGPKKPAGVVSMFAGMDPTALRGKLASRRHQSDDEVLEEQGQLVTSIPSAAQQPATAPPPFSDSDDDDMFRSEPKSTALAVKPASAAGGKVSSAAAGLFSDSDDDMFSSAKPSAQTVTSKSDDSNQQVTSDVSSAVSDPLAFTSSPAAGAAATAAAAANKPEAGPKKPAGAVSMFGGMDPTALRGKLASRRHQSDEEEQEEQGLKKDEKAEAVKETVRKAPLGGVSMFGGLPSPSPASRQDADRKAVSGFDAPLIAADTLPSMNKDRVKVQQKRKLPTRFRGKAASTKPAEELPTSGASQPQTDSRIATSQAALQGSDDEGDKPSRMPSVLPSPHRADEMKTSACTQPHITSQINTDDLFAKPITDSSKSAAFAAAVDLFGDNDDTLLFNSQPPPLPPADTETVAPAKTKSSHLDPLNDDDGLFSSSKTTAATKPPPQAFTLSDDDDDDIFTIGKSKDKGSKAAVNTQHGTDLFDDEFFSAKPKTTTAATAKKVSILDDDDDLFGDLPKTRGVSMTKSAKLDLDDDDDLFKVPTAQRTKKSSAVLKDSDLFGDDDIFSGLNVPPGQKKAKKAPVATTAIKSSPLTAADPELDDLFADLEVKRPVKRNMPVSSNPLMDD